MKNITEYITESFQSRAIDLDKLPEDKKSIGKLKILIKNYDKKGDDVEKEATYFDKMFDKIDNEKKRASLRYLRGDIWDAKEKNDRVRAVTKFLNAVFSYYKSEYNKEQKKYGYIYNMSYINGAVIACSEYMSDWFGEDSDETEKYMGKLLSAYQKITGQSFDKVFDRKQEEYTKAREIYDTEMKTITDFKSQMNDFKYVYYCGTDKEAHGIMEIYETSKFDSFDDGFEQAKKDCGPSAQYYYNYNPDDYIKNMIKNEGKLPRYGFCSGNYSFDEIDDNDHVVFMFGFLKELPKTMGKYSWYEKKMFYRGEIRQVGEGHWHHYDSLWNTFTKK